MQNIASFLIVLGGAVLAALAAAVSLAGTAELTSRRGHGYMHMVFYAILLMVAIPTFLSGRDFSDVASMSELESGRHPLMVVLQPIVSLFMLTVTGERILTHLIRPKKDTQIPVLLLVVFIVFWIGTVAAPAVFGAYPYISHDYVYPVVIGVAMLLGSTEEREMSFKAARNAMFAFMAAGLLLIPIQPHLVLEIGYAQGILPGVPRFAGLSPHPVSMGLLAQLGLLCLMAFPFERRWLNRLAWTVGLAVLFLAQSKTAWVSFGLCSMCMLVTSRGQNFMRRVSDPQHKEFGMMTVVVCMAMVLLVVLLAIFGNVGERLNSFFNTAEGAQITSLTGRDLIWAVAFDEWKRNPVFGYGPTLWDANFRATIGMPYATHAHNQFMDSLSRSGSVGAAALVIYGLVLMVLSVRYNRASGGLALGLFLTLVLRSISEVPLLLFGYSIDLMAQVLLLMVLAAAASHVALLKRSTIRRANGNNGQRDRDRDRDGGRSDGQRSPPREPGKKRPGYFPVSPASAASSSSSSSQFPVRAAP